MNNKVKLILYVVLTIAAMWFGYRFFSLHKAVDAADARRAATDSTEANPTKEPPAAVVVDTNLSSTNLVATNQIAEATNGATVVVTNASGATSNETANSTNQTNSVVTAAPPTMTAAGEHSALKGPSKASMIANLGAFVGTMILLGLLIAYDVTQFVGNRSVDFLFNDDGKGIKNPEYEQALQMQANGKPLEAIQMMRDYLKKNPREQYVALNIAEIYEKDLKNFLAAALEYEEVLKHKLPAERWGWAAIHLCNLYSKLNKAEQSVALLHRIVAEYGETAAAKKARKRLALFETVGDTELLGTDLPEDPNAPAVETAKPSAKIDAKKKQEPESNLPPGFRPKK